VLFVPARSKAWARAYAGETIDHMKNRDANRHPGIMRVMKVDSEFAGILVAVGFLVMGAVGLDIGRWFVLGALGLGVAVALLLRFTGKSDRARAVNQKAGPSLHSEIVIICALSITDATLRLIRM
jgi:formate-dependent nitrite reductase membrane component NrfD